MEASKSLDALTMLVLCREDKRSLNLPRAWQFESPPMGREGGGEGEAEEKAEEVERERERDTGREAKKRDRKKRERERRETYCWLVGNEGMRHPISPYIYPFRDYIVYLIPSLIPYEPTARRE